MSWPPARPGSTNGAITSRRRWSRLDRDLPRPGSIPNSSASPSRATFPVRGTAHVAQHGSDEYIPFRADVGRVVTRPMIARRRYAPSAAAASIEACPAAR